LAISLSIQKLLIDDVEQTILLTRDTISRFPAFLAFVAVVVPFYHGMNRHLDRCYLERNQSSAPRGSLLFDFVVFFVEASVLFAAAASIRAALQTFLVLAILLAVDTVWAFVSHFIHYRAFEPSVRKWAYINLVTLCASIGIYFFFGCSATAKAWWFFVFAVFRVVADYWFCWNFYFPREPDCPPVESE